MSYDDPGEEGTRWLRDFWLWTVAVCGIVALLAVADVF
jgi:hypothetical protein